MENCNTIDLHRLSWLGKPYMYKKTAVISHLDKQMIHQTTLTYLLSPNKFQKLWIKVINRLELRFLIDTFCLGHPVLLCLPVTQNATQFSCCTSVQVSNSKFEKWKNTKSCLDPMSRQEKLAGLFLVPPARLIT